MRCGDISTLFSASSATQKCSELFLFPLTYTTHAYIQCFTFMCISIKFKKLIQLKQFSLFCHLLFLYSFFFLFAFTFCQMLGNISGLHLLNTWLTNFYYFTLFFPGKLEYCFLLLPIFKVPSGISVCFHTFFLPKQIRQISFVAIFIMQITAGMC